MKSTCISAVVLSLLLCGSALAAPGDTYEQQQSARRQEEQQQERIFAPSVRRQEGPSEEGTVRLPVETEAFKIDRFIIEEEKGRRFQWLLKELEPYRHRRIGAQEETYRNEYQYDKKKKGIFRSGIGFTAGTEKQKDAYQNTDRTQSGSTVGSLEGSVTIRSGQNVTVTGSDVIAKKDIEVTGRNVTIEHAEETYTSEERHEYKRSGLTVSAGGETLNAVMSVAAPAVRATEVKDNRLQALYATDAVLKATDKKTGSVLQEAAKGDIRYGISVGIGTTTSKSETHSAGTVAKESVVRGGGAVRLKTDENIKIQGSTVSGATVTLAAGENIDLAAAEHRYEDTSEFSGKSGGISAGIGLGKGGGGVSVGISASRGKGKENESSVDHTGSRIEGREAVTLTSGNDTNIIGSQVKGGKVEVNVGGDLHVESLQDSHDYEAKSSQSGIAVGIGAGSSVSGGASRNKTQSAYDSVTEQAGIYAGKEGFDITVQGETHLKGAVIDSEAAAEKNRLTTGTLSWSDIENKAAYDSRNAGISVNINTGAERNERGVTPAIGMPAGDKATSTTKAAIAPGTIIVTDK